MHCKDNRLTYVMLFCVPSCKIVSIMMNHLDHCLCTYLAAVRKDLFQLLSMTCLYMAIKLNEYHHLILPDCNLSMESLIQLSRGSFTVEEQEDGHAIARMDTALQTLQYVLFHLLHILNSFCNTSWKANHWIRSKSFSSRNFAVYGTVFHNGLLFCTIQGHPR